LLFRLLNYQNKVIKKNSLKTNPVAYMQDNALTIEQILTRFVIYFEPFYKKLYPVLNTILFIHQ